MAVIKVWCLPELEEAKLNALHRELVAAAVSIYELGFKDENDMTCLFPSDMMKYGLGSEIIIEVTGLYMKPERTPRVRGLLAFRLGIAVSKRFPGAKIECFIHPFNPEDGFWTCKSYEDYLLQKEQAGVSHRENWADTDG